MLTELEINNQQSEIVIVGQGICGTFLSYYLHKAGKKCIVYDVPKSNSASKIGSGVINPVTGRRIVRTWMIEEVMPFAVAAYRTLEQKLNTPLLSQTNILDFHPTPQMQLAFDERLPQEKEYLKQADNPNQWQPYFNYPFGIGETNPCWLVDVQALMNAWRNELKQNNQLVEESFNPNNLKPSTLNLKPVIIFCDGVDGFNNPFFKNLPYTRMKGEALIVSIPNLPRNNIYKHVLNIVPWKNDLWWVGSSYEWSFDTIEPTDLFRQKTEMQLNNFLKIPFAIVDHISGERPANMERRPFVGLHPVHKNIGILNGMGTKGCSLAPYFANELAQHLINNRPINPLADVQRFSKVLSR